MVSGYSGSFASRRRPRLYERHSQDLVISRRARRFDGSCASRGWERLYDAHGFVRAGDWPVQMIGGRCTDRTACLLAVRHQYKGDTSGHKVRVFRGGSECVAPPFRNRQPSVAFCALPGEIPVSPDSRSGAALPRGRRHLEGFWAALDVPREALALLHRTYPRAYTLCISRRLIGTTPRCLGSGPPPPDSGAPSGVRLTVALGLPQGI